MIADLATFRALYPELNDVPDATVQAYLDDAGITLLSANWGRCYEKAKLLYAAHYAALFKARQAAAAGGGAVGGGPIQSASAEGLSVSFAIPSNRSEAATWWALSPYGQEYLVTQRQCGRRAYLSW